MGLIVLDTSFLVDHLRGVTAATEAFAGAVREGERTAASVITKVEIVGGMRSHERRATRNLFEQLEWIPVDDAVAELAGEYTRLYRRSHQGIDVPDYVIAATAFVLRAEMWTRNVKHFPMFPDLIAPY
jgi:predicted nucleic acid-binding protein